MTYRVYPGPHPSCTRLGAVEGDGDKKNDILFHGPIGASEPDRNVIFFPGDVQEYSEVMMNNYDYGKYVEWNLESTAERLSHRFPNSHIWVIKPHVMQLQTYSVYSNFVKSDPIGVPNFHDGQGSWRHLLKLLTCAMERVRQMEKEVKPPSGDLKPASSGGTWSVTEPSVTGDGDEQISVTDSDDSFASEATSLGPIGPSLEPPLTIVGFSKGCVVVNQLVYDLTEAQFEPKTKALVDRVRHIYWLDGGHNGEANTWITDNTAVNRLFGLNAELHIHVTPYQVHDKFRKHIGLEHKRFVDKLKAREFKVDSLMHFIHDERSIENHFKVLTVF